MNTIFLGIDGVLNSEDFLNRQSREMIDFGNNYFNNMSLATSSDYNISVDWAMLRIDPNKLEFIKKIAFNNDSNIVLISSWSTLYYYELIIDRLRALGLPVVGYIDGNITRLGISIKEFVMSHDIDNYVIVDGELAVDYDSELKNNLVLTNPTYGVTPREETRISGVLNRAKYRYK